MLPLLPWRAAVATSSMTCSTHTSRNSGQRCLVGDEPRGGRGARSGGAGLLGRGVEGGHCLSPRVLSVGAVAGQLVRVDLNAERSALAPRTDRMADIHI